MGSSPRWGRMNAYLSAAGADAEFASFVQDIAVHKDTPIQPGSKLNLANLSNRSFGEDFATRVAVRAEAFVVFAEALVGILRDNKLATEAFIKGPLREFFQTIKPALTEKQRRQDPQAAAQFDVELNGSYWTRSNA